MKIALVGPAGVGKGEVAKIIKKYRSDTTTLGSFATPIKQFIGKLCQMTDQHLYGELKEIPLTFIITPESFNEAARYYIDVGIDDYVSFDRMWGRFQKVFSEYIVGMGSEGLWGMQGISSRRIQQLFGTEITRHFRDSIWVDLLLDSEVNVVDDLRFLNEEVALRGAGFIIVRISGKESRITNEVDKKHASEMEMTSIVADYHIDNSFFEYNEASRVELENRVCALLLELESIHKV